MFAEALTEIVHRLDQARTNGLLKQYALVGGFAVSAWGAPRATRDIDFAIVLGTTTPNTLSGHLGGTYESAGPDDPLRGVFSVNISHEGEDIPVQPILLPPRFNSVVFSDVNTVSIFKASVPIVSWQSLVLLKLYPGGPQDLLDAKEILAIHQPEEAELNRIAALAVSLELSREFKRLVGQQQ